MEFTKSRQALRALVGADACIRPAPVCDPVTARLAEMLGFEAAMLAGSMASLTVLGAPDRVLITLTELAEQVRRICRSTPLPLIVDADHGFGNALNVMRTIGELETAGAAAATIEDTALPQGFDAAGVTMISVEEGLGKMRAALAGRSDPDFVVIARTSAAGLADRAEAVRRAEAYAASGVDALFLSGVGSRETLDAIAEVVRVPIFLGFSSPDVHDEDYLRSRGVRVWLFGHQPMLAAMRAAHETLKALRDGHPPAPDANTRDLLRALTREDDFDEASAEFLAMPGSASPASFDRH